jgi:hypothetical protein
METGKSNLQTALYMFESNSWNPSCKKKNKLATEIAMSTTFNPPHSWQNSLNSGNCMNRKQGESSTKTIVALLSYPILDLSSNIRISRGSHAPNFSISCLDCLLEALVLYNQRSHNKDPLLYRKDGDVNHPFSLEKSATTFSRYRKLHVLGKQTFPSGSNE